MLMDMGTKPPFNPMRCAAAACGKRYKMASEDVGLDW